MAGILKQLGDAIGARRTLTPRRHVAIDQEWCEAEGLGRMNLVWPWYREDDPTPFVDEHGRKMDNGPLLEVRAARTYGAASLVVWAYPDTGLVDGPRWARDLGRFLAGRLVDDRPILLTGALGHLARVDCGSDTWWRLVVPRSRSTAYLDLRVPTQHADAYWLQVETMLTTWGWTD